MASTYTADKVASTVMSRSGTDITAVYSTYEASVALVLDDIIQMVKVPAGATVLDVRLTVDDCDSGSGLVLDVGDGDDDDRYILGTTIGQGGGTVRLGSGITGATAATNSLHTYSAEDTIDIHVDTAPAGGGTGTLTLMVIYTLQS